MVTVVVCVRLIWLMKIAGLDSTSATLSAIVARSASTARIVRANPTKGAKWTMVSSAMASAMASSTGARSCPPRVAKRVVTTAFANPMSASTALEELDMPKTPLVMSPAL